MKTSTVLIVAAVAAAGVYLLLRKKPGAALQLVPPYRPAIDSGATKAQRPTPVAGSAEDPDGTLPYLPNPPGGYSTGGGETF